MTQRWRLTMTRVPSLPPISKSAITSEKVLSPEPFSTSPARPSWMMNSMKRKRKRMAMKKEKKKRKIQISTHASEPKLFGARKVVKLTRPNANNSEFSCHEKEIEKNLVFRPNVSAKS